MTTTTLHYLAAYGAPPAAYRFKPMTAAELREIRDGFALTTAADRADLDEARTDAYLLDEATLAVAHDMAADGVPVLMARDEDGLYFATAVEVWRVYSPCGARKWITAEDAEIAVTHAEAWVAEGDWADAETVDAFVEPYDGIDDDYTLTTDSWRRQSFTVHVARG